MHSSMLCIRHQYGCEPQLLLPIICIMHPYGSVLCIMHQNYGSILCTPSLNAVHPWLIDVHQASIVSIAQCCASGNNVAVHHASIWFDVVHPQLDDVHQASVWFNGAYQAYMLQYGLMLCIRHHYGTI